MDHRFAQRVSQIEPEGAYAVLAQAQELERQGRDIVHLEIGQPDFETFEPIRAAGKAAIEQGFTKYNPTPGYADLREAIAQDLKRKNVIAKPSEIVVGPGAKPGLVFPLLALVEPGDEVLYPNPGFPTYRAAIELAGGVPVPIPLIESEGFAFDIDALKAKITPRTKLCILNSPSNPTGGVASDAENQALADLAQKHGFWILSDEIYSRLVYDEPYPASIASLPGMAERTIIVDGFSKTFAMTGWRLGFSVMPEPLAKRVSLLLMHAIGCTAGFTQKAGVAALRDCEAQVAAAVSDYRMRRNLIADGLNAIPGIRCARPGGAFYAFPNVAQLGLKSKDLADRLLNEAGIACLSGTDFGSGGEGYLRFSYASSPENIRRALERLADFARKL